MLRLLCRWLPAAFFLLFPFLHLAAQDVPAAAAQLAASISERSAPGAVSVNIVNRSSLSPDAVTTLRGELLRQLQAKGWRARTTEQGGTTINVVLSENYRSYVWTAEILEADARKVAVVELPRPKLQPHGSGDELMIARTLLISSPEPLLDVALLEGNVGEGTHLLALTPGALEMYQMRSSQWQLAQSQPLGLFPQPGRDLRGRIVVQQGSIIDAYLPGVHCSGVVTQSLSLTCRQSDDPWPLADKRGVLAFYASRRNYFTGVLSGSPNQNGNPEPFYSAAVLSDRVLFSGIDGRVREIAAGPIAPVATPKWGSSMAGLESACVHDLLLASAAGDYNQPDAIVAIAASNADFRPVSQAVAFSGPILALNTAAGREQAVAIVASSPGYYEAYLLTPRCGF